MKKISKEKRNKIIELFNTDLSKSDIAKQIGCARSTIKKVWEEHFSKEDLNSRQYIKKPKNYKKILNKEQVINYFYTDISLSKLEEKLKIDQRKIRVLWRQIFTKEEISGRTSRIMMADGKNRALSKEIIEKIYELLETNSPDEVAELLNISSSVIRKYLIKNKQLQKIVLDRTNNKRAEVLKHSRANIITEQNQTISKNKKEEIAKYFDTNLFMAEIASKVELCPSSIANVFDEFFGKEKRKARSARLKPKQMRKSLEALIKAGQIGSRPELAFYKLLDEKLDTNIKHHDLDLMPPFEIDITIPDYKIAIFWDGVGHQKPIFGEKIFKVVVYRDKQKRKYIDSIGWRWFEVIDTESHYKMDSIYKYFEQLINKFPELEDITNEQG